MPFAGIDEQHLPNFNLGPPLAIMEVQDTEGDDQRDRDGVAMLGDLLAGLEAKADHPHRTAVSDLLEAEGTGMRPWAVH